MGQAGLSTPTTRPFLQPSRVKRAFLDTTRMLPSSQGTLLHPKKLLTRPLKHLTEMALFSMIGSQLFTPRIVSMTTTKTDGAGVPWSKAKNQRQIIYFDMMAVILLTKLINKL